MLDCIEICKGIGKSNCENIINLKIKNDTKYEGMN